MSRYDAKLPESMGWIMTILINIKVKRILAVVDTAAQATIVSEKFIQNLNIRCTRCGTHSDKEEITIPTYYTSGKETLPCRWVSHGYHRTIHSGIRLLKISWGAILDINANIVMVGDEVMPATMKRNLSNEETVICRVKLCRKTTIPPNSGRMLKCHMNNATNGDFVIEPVHRHRKIRVPDSVVTGGNIIRICVMNLTDHPVTISAK